MKTKIAFFITSMFLIFSCKKEATVKLPKQENKLVVTCFISPDDTLINASVQTSIPKYGYGTTNADEITDATVVLSDGINSVTLLFDNDLYSYVISSAAMPIISGKTYYLTVTTPDGKTVSANTTVPYGRLSIQSVNTALKTNNNNNGSPYGNYTYFDYDLNIAVNDLADQTTFVELYFQNMTSSKTPTYNAPPQDSASIDTYYAAATDPFFDTDEHASKSVYIYKYTGSIYSSDSLLEAYVRVSALNCSREFYLYNESVTSSATNGDNPFAEPVLIYSNIKNGFGCFGAYLGTYENKKINR